MRKFDFETCKKGKLLLTVDIVHVSAKGGSCDECLHVKWY